MLVNLVNVLGINFKIITLRCFYHILMQLSLANINRYKEIYQVISRQVKNISKEKLILKVRRNFIWGGSFPFYRQIKNTES